MPTSARRRGSPSEPVQTGRSKTKAAFACGAVAGDGQTPTQGRAAKRRGRPQSPPRLKCRAGPRVVFLWVHFCHFRAFSRRYFIRRCAFPILIRRTGPVVLNRPDAAGISFLYGQWGTACSWEPVKKPPKITEQQNDRGRQNNDVYQSFEQWQQRKQQRKQQRLVKSKTIRPACLYASPH